jgi:hypothetical protein
MSLRPFLKEVIELAVEKREKRHPSQPRGYVIRTTREHVVKKILTNTKKAEVALAVNVEPFLGEPVRLLFTAQLRRGGNNDPRRKNS